MTIMAAGDVSRYLALITGEHQQPLYRAVIAALLQGQVDNQALLDALQLAFDVDTAVGDQLDAVGERIDSNRALTSEIAGVYFSFDIDGVGFDQGIWWSPGQPLETVISLPDDYLRLKHYARIALNRWDGTLGGLYEIWNDILDELNGRIPPQNLLPEPLTFGRLPYGSVPYGAQSAPPSWTLKIFDNGDMTITVQLQGRNLDAMAVSMFESAELDISPAGVKAIYEVVYV